MSGIIGKKIGMTSIYRTEGDITKQIACTVIQAGPCVVTQVKTVEKDGYYALQLGYGEKKDKNTTKQLQGHFKKANTGSKYKLVEFRYFEENKFNLGDTVKVEDVFEEGDLADVVGTTKGKGFQGVVKRHNFSGVGDATHGQHNRQRAPGSIGAASYPARVFKGLKMAGRTGNKRVKMQNIEILKIIPEENLIVVKGAIPGSKNGYVLLEK